MRYRVLATDYDGTLAWDGRVARPTLEAMKRLLASGRQLLLVTGREIADLLAAFPEAHIFAFVVAENGAVLYRPSAKEERLLCKPPPAEFVQTLRSRGVTPLAVGRVIVATWKPYEAIVLETIRDLGLELQIIFNKESVMVLPSGINKATGLVAALDEMGVEPQDVVGVGDAENDHAFLEVCGCAAAVANALPPVKKAVDVVLQFDHGAGVTALIDQIIEDDSMGQQTR